LAPALDPVGTDWVEDAASFSAEASRYVDSASESGIESQAAAMTAGSLGRMRRRLPPTGMTPPQALLRSRASRRRCPHGPRRHSAKPRHHRIELPPVVVDSAHRLHSSACSSVNLLRASA